MPANSTPRKSSASFPATFFVLLLWLLSASACRPDTRVTAPQPARAAADPIVAMDLGAGKSCAVHSSGRLTCRGAGRPPHRILGVEEAAGVVIHRDEVCLWTRGGSAQCVNYADDRPGPAFAVPGEVVALVSGGLQIYALTRAGDVIAIPQGRPSPLTEGHDAVEVAANDHIHCVRHRDGAVSCASDLAKSQQAILTFAELAGARRLSMQYDTLCALMPDAATRCLRLSGIGALTATASAQPVLPPFTRIASGSEFTCGLSTAGTVTCWGENHLGQLGDPALLGNGVAQVRGVDDATDLFVGPEQACVRRRGGSVWCWGDDQLGGLGEGLPVATRVPPPPRRLPGLRQLTVGDDRTCALKTDGSLACWGMRAGWTEPVPIPTPGPADFIVASGRFDCLLLRTGRITCRAAQTGDLVASGTWQEIPGLAGVVAFDTFANLGASLHDDGMLRSWDITAKTTVPPRTMPSAGREVRFGYGDTGLDVYVRTSDGRVLCERPECVELAGLTDVVAMAAGWDLFCALRKDGSLHCANRRSQHRVFEVSGRHAAVAAHMENLCALSEDRREIRCWGDARLGPLVRHVEPMLGTPALSQLPEPAQDIVVGSEHMCVRFADERLTCWGSNLWGQLGDGRSGMRRTPAPYPEP